eukprot:SM000032S12020  [mRNA]  locus=s32:22240:24567:+ [translate_table: standard]
MEPAAPGSVRYARAVVGVVVDTLVQKWATAGAGPAAKACAVRVAGRTAVVTGPTSGIGRETALELAKAGAHVVLACRNVAAGRSLVQEWKAKYEPDGVVISAEVLELDLSSFESVRAFARVIEERKQPLHVLINNAGILSLGGKRKIGESGLEEHIMVNYMAPALLTLLLLPALLRSSGARVINVSSQMHEQGTLDLDDLNFSAGRRRYGATAAYCQSKLAQVMFTNVLHRKLPADARVDIIAVHPGEVLTNVVRTLPKWMQWMYRVLFKWILFTPSQGARGPLFCAADPLVLQYASSIRAAQSLDGPYYTSKCRPKRVAKQALNAAASELLWERTLVCIGLPSTYLDTVLTDH